MQTLCLDLSPSYLRGMVLDLDGRVVADRRRVELRKGVTLTGVLSALDTLVAELGAGSGFERASLAFPGLVVDGAVRAAPGLVEEWVGLRVGAEVGHRLGVTTKVASDAELVGRAVVEGRGVEMVLTLGVRLGAALFVEGRALSELDLGAHPYGDGGTYDERLGNVVRKQIGNEKWNRRLIAALNQLHPIFNYRRIYLGGPNAEKIDPAAPLAETVRVVDATASLRGGLGLFGEAPRP
jgi:polyphosphate glucokinase